MKIAPYKEFILTKMKGRDTTLDDLQAALWEEHGIYASRTLLHRFVRDIGLSFKKNRTRQRTGQAGRGAGAVAVAPGPSRS